MNVPAATQKARAAIDWARPLRYLVRLPLLLVHLLVCLPLTLLTINTVGERVRLRNGECLEHRMIRWWQATLVRLFGIRILRRGEPLPGAALLVANHLSWLDISLIHSQRMACFVAKSEIAGWPAVGWLASRAGTIYHKRGSTQSLASVAQVMVERLRAGLAVAVFPEGGTGSGDHVRTFHARIFQAAIDADVPAQPVALRFLRGGALTTDISFRPGEQFFPNFFRVLGEPATVAEIMFLEPVAVVASDRRRMAERARERIVAALGFVESRRAAAASGDEPPTDDLDPLANADAGR